MDRVELDLGKVTGMVWDKLLQEEKDFLEGNNLGRRDEDRDAITICVHLFMFQDLFSVLQAIFLMCVPVCVWVSAKNIVACASLRVCLLHAERYSGFVCASKCVDLKEERMMWCNKKVASGISVEPHKWITFTKIFLL